jgi:hypothetical protein
MSIGVKLLTLNITTICTSYVPTILGSETQILYGRYRSRLSNNVHMYYVPRPRLWYLTIQYPSYPYVGRDKL